MTDVPSPPLPGLFHIGWVVRDCAAAQQELGARLGAGPFLSAGEESRFDQALVNGKLTPFSLRIAFGALGGVLLELLEPLDDRSPHAAFLAERGEGMHHLAFLVDDFDQRLAAAREACPGASLLIDGTGPGNPVRWVYLDGSMARGTVIELLERTPRAEAVFGRFLELVDDALYCCQGRRREEAAGHDADRRPVRYPRSPALEVVPARGRVTAARRGPDPACR
jgi:methylmalonyl-CoA/ethylmalonyl-CoA epimerase